MTNKINTGVNSTMNANEINARTKSINGIMNQANRLMSVCNMVRNFKRANAIREIAFRYYDNIRACVGRFNYNDDSEYNKEYSRAQYMNAKETKAPEFSELSHTATSAICPLDFDTTFDAYNYAMAHRLDESPLAVAIPTDAHGTDYGRSLALNGVKLFAVWSDELEETANGYVYTTEAGAREAMAQVEDNDKEAGVYEPNYWKVSDMTKYFA